MPKRISQEIKERILNEYRTSGLSQKKISLRNNISIQTLQSWLRKEKSRPTFDFVSLAKNNLISENTLLPKKEKNKERDFILQFASGAKLKIPSTIEVAYLIDILRSFQ